MTAVFACLKHTKNAEVQCYSLVNKANIENMAQRYTVKFESFPDS